MEQIKSKNDEGKQTVEYYQQYYEKNKERIKERNKERYLRKRSTQKGTEEHRKLSNEYTKEYRKRHPERIKEQRKKQHQSRKYRAMALIGEVKCDNCGCDAIDFLEFNHKNGNGCKEHRENRANMIDKILTHNRSTGDLNILCRVCNALEYLERKNINASRYFKIIWDNKS